MQSIENLCAGICPLNGLVVHWISRLLQRETLKGGDQELREIKFVKSFVLNDASKPFSSEVS